MSVDPDKCNDAATFLADSEVFVVPMTVARKPKPRPAMTARSPSPAVRAFCVGQAKSGTASLAGMLSANHRAAHEPEREELLDMILRESRGDISPQGFREYLIERDARLDLEYDISWANQFVVDHLLAAFPAAKFIVLIRDCNTWLKSIVGHFLSRDVPPDVLTFLRWWFRPERYPHSRHDSALKAHGLSSISAYLHAWNRHVDLCNRAIPADRGLVIRTHELVATRRRLAGFLRIPEHSVDIDKGHVNRTAWYGSMEALVDLAYVDEMIQAICGDNMNLYFPGLGRAGDAHDPAP